MEGGYYQQKRLSPTGIAMVVLLHGAALAALLTAKGIVVIPDREPPIVIRSIKELPPPDPEIQPKPKETPQHQTVIDRVDPLVKVPLSDPPKIDIAKIDLPPITYTPPGRIDVPPPPPPPPIHEAVRTEARIDNGSPLQPPYPASAQREGAEGTVQVRIAIGPDGRVKAVQKVQASRDDFYAATERQALRYWRFKPATLDGRPIESSKLMTVHFRLDDLG